MTGETVWETDKYYDLARKGSLNKNHFGIREITRLAGEAKKILDLGCGEGTRLASLASEKTGVGIDISRKAIGLAQKRYPKLKFIEADGTRLPFADNEFGLVYSAFVLEHLENPERALKEAIRVTRPGGHLVLIAPNYGAPNRASPVYSGSRSAKLFGGFVRDMFGARATGLGWKKVEGVTDPKKYTMDMDTRIEPYIRTLIAYLKTEGLTIEKWSSCWEEETAHPRPQQKIFRVLANMGFYPFIYWGPHLVVTARKSNRSSVPKRDS